MSNNYIKRPHTKQTVQGLWNLEKLILDSLDFKDVVQKTVDSILHELGYMKLGYRIVVLALLNEKRTYLERIAISQTPSAKRALNASTITFQEIKIPVKANDNLCIKVLKSQRFAHTNSWPDILCPPFSQSEAEKLQEIVGIKSSFICPVHAKNKTIGVMIFSMIKDFSEISEDEKDLILNFTDIVGLSVQNAKLYSSLENTTNHLKKANKRLKELDLLKDEFVSIASHELRTPMTAIKSYLWMALNKSPEPLKDPMKKYLEISYASTERLISLVNDMLTVSRIERKKIELKLERVDLRNIVQLVYDELKVSADEKHIQFEIRTTDDTQAIVHADKVKIREVFQNLVGNALKFTPANGRIQIHIRNTPHDAEVAVEDTGPGIPADALPKLFQKFSKIDYSYANHVNQPGTGLGLYISKQIVSLHGGKITVESTVHKGSTFTVVLPIYTEKGGV